MRMVFALLLILAISSLSHAQTPQIDRINIVEAGIYRSEIVKKTPDSKDPTGFHITSDEIKLIERSTTILAKRGVEFGVRYVVVGTPKDEIVDIRVVIRHPADGLRNPKTGEKYFQTEWLTRRKIGGSSFAFYLLEDDWECVPGVWSFELWYKDRKLAEQSFALTAP